MALDVCQTHFESGLILNVKYIHIIFYHELLFLGVGRVLNFKDFFWTVRHCLNHPQGPYPQSNTTHHKMAELEKKRAGKCSIAPGSAIVLRRAWVRGSVHHAIWRIF